MRSKFIHLRRNNDKRRSIDEPYSECQQILAQWLVRDGIGALLDSIASFGGHPILFAGCVRDALMCVTSESCSMPRDYDIGVRGMSAVAFRNLMGSYSGNANQYGGFTGQLPNGVNFDCWRIEDTNGVTAHNCEPSLSNVLRTFVLDINAIAFDPTSEAFIDIGCLAAIRNRQIGIVDQVLHHNSANFAVKARRLGARLNYPLSEQLQDFVTAWFDSDEAVRQQNKYQSTGATSGISELPSSSTSDCGNKDACGSSLPFAA